jgi:hypothetical protein
MHIWIRFAGIVIFDLKYSSYPLPTEGSFIPSRTTGGYSRTQVKLVLYDRIVHHLS